MATSTTSDCGLYLAPSTIPRAGLGMYTGIKLREGDWVGPGDPAIPILDLEWHNGHDYTDLTFHNPFGDYVWSGNAIGMRGEVSDLELITAFWPGLNAAINSHPVLNNLGRSIPVCDSDFNATVRRHTHPMVGSMTPYLGGASYVKANVPAGGELFKQYGDIYFLERNSTQPVASDYPLAATLLAHFDFRIPESHQPQVYDLMKNIQEIWDIDAPRRLSKSKEIPIMHALPEAWEDTRKMLESTGRNKNAESILKAFRKLHQKQHVRSLEWLQEYGVCVDVIETKMSGIPGSGRGAFARHAWQEGEVLTVSPVITNRNKTILHMNEIGPDPGDPTKYIQVKKIGTQLVNNYCWSHPNTTVALCPYGVGVANMNHHKSRANVRLEWPEDGVLGHESSWLTTPIDEWDENASPKLAFQYVATHPIKPGDELFLDYGAQWSDILSLQKTAWPRLAPVQLEFPFYASALAWNRHFWNNELLPTEAELASKMIAARFPQAPDNFQLRCHSIIVEYAKMHAHLYKNVQWDGSSIDDKAHPEYGKPCRVLKRYAIDPGNDTTSPTYEYDVMMTTEENYETGNTTELKLFNIPRRCLRWFDRPHTSDIHLTIAFRLTPGMPDEMVPTEWKNLVNYDQLEKDTTDKTKNEL